MRFKVAVFALSLVIHMTSLAQHGSAEHKPYAGMQERPIKSLSDADIRELKRGGGWGLALAAELNGMPGPAHVLELKDKLDLNTTQITQIQGLFDEMKRAAIVTGEQLIAAEADIERAFASGKVEAMVLRRLLASSEALRAELRFIHLSQHYKTTSILNSEQIKLYNTLRGYTKDPCQVIPQGHDPVMHRRHMGCK